ncbi:MULTISPECIES: FtsX-like permease family protein [Bacillus]|uniref:FtsX-like permease family protein n=1 Tax=Bacillus glycinifermentans TaxID=1664069 RepID=A0AAJ3Z2B8_9BACI|nr:MULTISPECIES: ABC transporter permease [Bacillus]KKB74033.1 ABC transporter permease [Bacillus sp. TH008]MDU0070208.1 ABC transporter permease [Bacillus sp. IG6]MED8017858.1 ABC transporter permease [Bacillus glycinifermentans]QAT67637.1 FtsX-like permease family protein [Bacillus glycinifermentans]WKB77300.1 ABC transporter permease [Bacillus glycinifermentans]
MTFRQFAFNNVLRNKRLYAAYFLSSMFTVMVFFTFAMFTFHPAINGDAGQSGMGLKALSGMYVSGGIIFVFSFFFILYSMSSFLQSRKKEFGVLMIQGMSMRQIRMMVFLENMLIGFFATIGGIAVGLIFAKLILLAAENVLIIENRLNFYFPLMAVIVTFVSFTALFLFISFLVTFVLRTGKLIDLLKGNKKPKGEPKASVFLAILAAVLLASGYYAALTAKGNGVFLAMLPVTVVVILGTYLLFTQLSVYVIRRIKKRETLFWRKTNMLLFSDLSYRIKDNARTFFMVAIISTVAFSAIGTLYGVQSVLLGATKSVNPNTFTYQSRGDDKKAEQDTAFINQTLRDRNVKAQKAEAEFKYVKINGEEQLLVKLSDYNRLADLIGEKPLKLAEGKAAAVEFDGYAGSYEIERNKETIELKTGKRVQADHAMYSRAVGKPGMYYVVSDEDFEQLKKPVSEERFYAWQAQGEDETSLIKTGEILNNKLDPLNFMAVDYEVYDLSRGYGPMLFIGLFIGIVFFVSAGSFLYFRLYTDLDEDKEKFKAISKMGLTGRELKKVLTRQMAILFFAPIIVALIHGAVALTALSNAFRYNLFTESAIVLGVFFAIQVIYFFIVRFYYTKQIKAALR